MSLHKPTLKARYCCRPLSCAAAFLPAVGKLPDLNSLQSALAGIGYHPDRRIIAYDDEGGGWAGKLLWVLDVIGHEHWAYLNGGLYAWAGAGQPLSHGPFQATHTSADVAITISDEAIAETEDVFLSDQ